VVVKIQGATLRGVIASRSERRPFGDKIVWQAHIETATGERAWVPTSYVEKG
jgi:hypothetical protein